MTTFQRTKHEARRAEQRSDWRRAIELYRQALRLDEQTDASSDLSLWNRIGDLHMRLGETAQAVECYEQAAHRYATHDLPTSAIALCNKILRVAPERYHVYRQLGRLHGLTGLAAEGRAATLQFVEAALDAAAPAEALEAVQEYVGLTGDDQVRLRAAALLEARGRLDDTLAQLRLARQERVAAGRGTGEIEDRIAAVERALDAAGKVEGPGGGPESTLPPRRPESAGLPGGTAPEAGGERQGPAELAARLRDEVAEMAGGTRLQAPDSRHRGDAVEDRSGSLARRSDELHDALDRFRSSVSSRLEAAGPAASYDLGVAFEAMGLIPEAVERLRIGIAAPGRLRAAHARLSRCLGADTSVPAPSSTEAPDSGAGAAGADHEATESEERSAGTAGPRADVAHHRPALDGELFRARLAQHQIREAQETRRVHHLAHLDLGAAYAGMGLGEEALRELRVALDGPASCREQALQLLAQVAASDESEPSTAVAALLALRDAGVGDLAKEIGTGLAASWPASRPERSRLLAALGIADPGPGADGPAVEGTGPGVVDGADLPVREGGAAEADAGGVSGAPGASDASELYQELRRHEEARDFERAVEVVDRLLARRPDDVVLYHQKAELASALYDEESLMEAYLGLAACLVRQNAARSARTVYQRVLDLDPGHAAAREALERLNAVAAMPPVRPVPSASGPGVKESGAAPGAGTPAGPAEFDAMLDELREELPEETSLAGDAEAHFELGVAFKQMGMWSEAIEELERSVPALADPLPAWEAIGECLHRSGRLEEAAELLARAEAHPSPDERGRLGVVFRNALVLIDLGRTAEARQRLERVVELDPAFRDAARRLSALSR